MGFDVADPGDVRVDAVDAQADQLDVEPFELLAAPGELAQLGGANRGKVRRMREQDDPLATKVRQLDRALGRYRHKIRRGLVETRQTHVLRCCGLHKVYLRSG